MKWWVVSLTAVLAGCAGEPIRTTASAPGPKAHLQRVEDVENWRADGRVAIQHGDEGWSATMRWQQQGSEFQIRLIAPLGRGTFQLAGDDEQVELIVPDGGRFYSTDAQSLMAEHLGWSLPVDGAEYWLRGLAAPQPPPSYMHSDDSGRLQDLQQAGWRVSFLRRMQVDGFDLPAKLFLLYRDLKVRIVISAWKLTP